MSKQKHVLTMPGAYVLGSEHYSQIASALGRLGAGKPRRPHKKHYSAAEIKRRTKRLLEAREKK